jgi:hypothetical protein
MLNIVREKEHHLRKHMLIMGLSRGSVWISWLIYSMVMNTLATLITIGTVQRTYCLPALPCLALPCLALPCVADLSRLTECAHL